MMKTLKCIPDYMKKNNEWNGMRTKLDIYLMVNS